MKYLIVFFICTIQQLIAQNNKSFHAHKRVNENKIAVQQKYIEQKIIDNGLLPAPTATSVLPAFTPNSQTICVGEPITFTNTSVDAVTYNWDFGDGSANTIVDNPTYSYTASGQYIITLTAFNGTLQGIATDIITVNDFPNADFTILQLNNCDGTTQINCIGSFTNNSWSFSDGTTVTDTCQIIKTFSTPTTYTLTHIVNPNSYCSSTLTKEFTVTAFNEDLGVIPNVITPNFDDKNDYVDFTKYIKCGDFEFQIFDRWGLLITSSTQTKQGIWDGRTSSGQEVTNGTYFYTIKTANKSYKGTINVFR